LPDSPGQVLLRIGVDKASHEIEKVVEEELLDKGEEADEEELLDEGEEAWVTTMVVYIELEVFAGVADGMIALFDREVDAILLLFPPKSAYTISHFGE
jgi:hypothetical protein